ncbi:Cytochrome p450 CYP199A2 [Streptomyces antimycoticus]
MRPPSTSSPTGCSPCCATPTPSSSFARTPTWSSRWWKSCCRSNRPCSFPERTTLDDIEIAGTTIPQGASLWLVPASGNRDPQRFPEPDRFLPDRPDNQHFGFGTGIHNCIGSPLARLEAQTALAELVRRLDNPRLVEDPPLPPQRRPQRPPASAHRL